MATMYVAAAVSRTRSGVVALLIAVSLLLSTLPAAAGPNASYGLGGGWDFLDATNITWEQAKPKPPKPNNVTWESALRSITWE